jgi:hypothetical protein
MNWYKQASLKEWFGQGKKGDWVNICSKGLPACGRSDTSEGGYPKCLPRSKAKNMSASERKSSCERKRKVERKSSRKEGKPNFVSTKPKKKS